MSTYYYQPQKKAQKSAVKLRLISFALIGIGMGIVAYIFFPLVSWQMYFAPVFAAQSINAPIPKDTIVDKTTVLELVTQAKGTLGVDYTNAKNWFPTQKPSSVAISPKISSYTLSIPKLSIQNAIVSTTGYDLSRYLVNYGGTAIPPENGNAVIFGHSTLPQLFNPSDYKTIFATLYKLQIGDLAIANVSGVSYTYRIFSITVVDPDDTSVLSQSYDDSYLTLITCTPPGTVWKRLIIKAKLEKI
ncbi:MAG: sortase [Candidatus Levybacteria bacterium]|nr:sortase [Candidatus Levybacteria bacterium]